MLLDKAFSVMEADARAWRALSLLNVSLGSSCVLLVCGLTLRVGTTKGVVSGGMGGEGVGLVDSWLVWRTRFLVSLCTCRRR